MKKHFIKILPAIFLAFVTSFMIYIYEPILIYASNMDDVWFDFYLMFPNILLYSFIMFSALSTFFIIIYILEKKYLKKERMYKIILILSWVIFIITYIQGNYLAGSLPVLDGTTIDWKDFTKESIITVCISILVILIQIIALKKIKYEKTIKMDTFIILVVFVMLLASFTSILNKKDVFKGKTIVTATNDNIEKVSSDKNFFIFLADAVASESFKEVLNESEEYSNILQDFTYFSDAAGGYAVTKDSIPLILTGKWNKNEKEFSEFYNDAFDEAKLFKNLEKRDYIMNLYETELYCNKKNAKRFSNIVVDGDSIDKLSFFKQLTKYVLFKYLPYQLKKYAKIETADFKLCRINNEVSSYYDWEDDVNYNIFKEEELILDSNRYFKFYHTEGAHVPYNYDGDLNKIPVENGTYKMKVKSTLKMINEFIKSLKENEVYENSVIIIMADHGIGPTKSRANPILYIKGFNEKHDEMEVSDVPMSYEDLSDAYEELLDGKKSTELFSNIDMNRNRTYIENFFKDESHLVEYVIKGKAYESEKIEKTGIEYNR